MVVRIPIVQSTARVQEMVYVFEQSHSLPPVGEVKQMARDLAKFLYDNMSCAFLDEFEDRWIELDKSNRKLGMSEDV